MNVAFIPVRGGSKSIRLKNIRPLCGKPLVYWTVKAACECRAIDKVYIATDSDTIRDAVLSFCKGSERDIFSKAEVISRSAESASDTASTESAMLEFAQKYVFENIVLVQATSPLLTASDLDRGFDEYRESGCDSVLSVVRQKRFCWETDENGNVCPVNYDVFARPRRQDFNGFLVENGAFYITSKRSLLSSGNRVSGTVRSVEMDEASYFEIDEPDDWMVIEAIMRKKGMSSAPDLSGIKMLLTDCDGCLTDNGMYYSEKGDELKKFNTRDGMGLGLLRERGIITGIITSEKVDLNRRRSKKLKLDILEEGCRDKLCVVKRICKERGLTLDEVCYIGDDINDIEAVRAVGFGCCPADAMSQVIDSADYVAKTMGGRGVVREVAELILNSEGK